MSLYTRFTNMFGASIHETTMRLNPLEVQTVLVDGEVVLERGRFTRVDGEVEWPRAAESL